MALSAGENGVGGCQRRKAPYRQSLLRTTGVTSDPSCTAQYSFAPWGICCHPLLIGLSGRYQTRPSLLLNRIFALAPTLRLQ